MKRWVPTRAELRASRWLSPVAHHLEDERLWHMNRGSVARAVAIGLFFGFMVPVAQFLCAIATAIVLRAHVAIAAAATLVTNPLTFPPIYWAAYKVGRFILGEPDDEAGALRIESETEALLAKQSFIEGIWTSMQAAGAPLLVGLAAFAVGSEDVWYGLAWNVTGISFVLPLEELAGVALGRR
jgi:uncharacterized protein (DUF2062 family)